MARRLRGDLQHRAPDRLLQVARADDDRRRSRLASALRPPHLVHGRASRAARIAALLAACASSWACRRAPHEGRAPGEARPLPPFPPEVVARAAAEAEAELERYRRERDERFLEAIDPGEQEEHTRRIRRAEIDAGKVPIADLFQQGEAIFERRFTASEGLGTGLLGRPAPALSRVENAARIGGPDALSCRECHGHGGDDGHGELHQRAWLDGDGRHLRTAHPRVPPHVAGLGLVERLAAEMTEELAGRLETGRSIARETRAATKVLLQAKGVSFGEATVAPDGSTDTAGARGVDRDLVVRPFGWKGTTATLSDFVRAALPQHMGLQPLPPRVAAEGGAAALRPDDDDRDGVSPEIHDGQLASLVAYLALLDVPQLLPPVEPAALGAWRRGAARFRDVGCAGCHVPALPLKSARYALTPGAPGGAPITLDLLADNQQPPRAEQFDYTRDLEVPLFSDLKRHDLGPALAERSEKGVAPSVFLTRPLWGLGDRAYFLHDGRARTLRDAVRLHGGEAQAAADAYARLPPAEARAIDVFVLSLRRAPQARIAP